MVGDDRGFGGGREDGRDARVNICRVDEAACKGAIKFRRELEGVLGALERDFQLSYGEIEGTNRRKL